MQDEHGSPEVAINERVNFEKLDEERCSSGNRLLGREPPGTGDGSGLLLLGGRAKP